MAHGITLTGIFVLILSSTSFAQGFSENQGCINAECHTDIKAFDVIHEPLNDECETCHESNGGDHPRNDGMEFSLVDDVPELCYMCHDAKNEKQTVHDPVADGDCLACHSPHSSNQPFLLVNDENTSICESCHDLDWQEKSFVHGPVVGKFCTSCHEVHQSDEAALLKKPSPALCFTCHSNMQSLNSKNVVHGAFTDNCLGCHLPHGSDNASLLASQDPDLCFGCHDDIEKEVKSKNLHQPLVEQKKCLRCHQPHAADYEFLLTAEIPQVCFNCHKKSKKTIQFKLQNKIFAHPPAADGDCGACHTPHGSNFRSLLKRSFPDGAYVNGQVTSFELCFDCHDSELMESKETTSATNFRNGKQNLHYVHVRREKGRNCDLCHDMHASDNPALIGDTVKFGTWEMPINFRSTKNGGSCLPGCHQKRTYRRSE